MGSSSLAFSETANITNARALIVGGESGVSANSQSTGSGGGGRGGFIDQTIALSGGNSFPVL